MAASIATGKLKPAVCIDAVLGDLDYEQALSVVSRAGLGAFEFWSWWDKDLDALRAARASFDLDISACGTKLIT